MDPTHDNVSIRCLSLPVSLSFEVFILQSFHDENKCRIRIDADSKGIRILLFLMVRTQNPMTTMGRFLCDVAVAVAEYILAGGVGRDH